MELVSPKVSELRLVDVIGVMVKGIGAGGLGFNSRTGKIRHNRQRFATRRRYSDLCCRGATSHGDGPATFYTLQRNTASIMKI